MGTTADKLTYLNGTKQAIKDSLNLGGANITNEPFREYTDTLKELYVYYMNNGLDVVWENWEKVIGTGTALTLNQTLNAPMKINLKGNTSQFSTTGKNLLNCEELYSSLVKTTIDSDGWATSSDNNTGNSTSYCNYYTKIPTGVTIKTNTTYTVFLEVKSKSVTGTGVNISISNTNASFIPKTSMTGIYLSTLNAGETYKYNFTSKDDLTGVGGLLRTIVAVPAGSSVNFVYRLSLIEGDVSLSNFNYEPYTGGIPSPNPDYPQDIHVVSGDNIIRVEGKNLVQSLDKVYNNLYFNGYNTQEQYPFKAGTYTISYKNTNNLSTYMKVSSGTLTNLGQNKTITFTADENFNIWFYRSGITVEEFSEVQLEKNNKATTYTPYVSQSYPINLPEGMELCKIGDYQDRIFKTSGKNLIDISTVYSYTIYTGSSTISPTSDRYAYLVEAKPNTTYTFSRSAVGSASLSYLVLLDNFIDGENNTYTSATNVGSNLTQTITTGANTKYVMFLSGSGESTNIMLNEGSTALPYEPYGKVWYIEKKIGKVVLDGSESWQGGDAGTVSTNFRYFYITIPKSIGTDTNNIKCTHFKIAVVYLQQTTTVSIIGTATTDTNNLRTLIDKTLINNPTTNEEAVSNWKNWLNTHNTTVYYVLATPTYTKITDTDLIGQLNDLEKAKSYNEQTNVSQVNNDLASVLNSTALKVM